MPMNAKIKQSAMISVLPCNLIRTTLLTSSAIPNAKAVTATKNKIASPINLYLTNKTTPNAINKEAMAIAEVKLPNLSSSKLAKNMNVPKVNNTTAIIIDKIVVNELTLINAIITVTIPATSNRHPRNNCNHLYLLNNFPIF